ncbi:unnamed protein product, partial [Scytosiphon promiscuus]
MYGSASIGRNGAGRGGVGNESAGSVAPRGRWEAPPLSGDGGRYARGTGGGAARDSPRAVRPRNASSSPKNIGRRAGMGARKVGGVGHSPGGGNRHGGGGGYLRLVRDSGTSSAASTATRTATTATTSASGQGGQECHRRRDPWLEEGEEEGEEERARYRQVDGGGENGAGCPGKTKRTETEIEIEIEEERGKTPFFPCTHPPPRVPTLQR